MKVDERQVGTVDVYTPSDALVDQDATSFSELLDARLQSPNPRIVVSLEKVPCVDSEAIEGLLNATDRLGETASCLKLAATPATCREIFELTGVASRFRFFSTVQDAVRSFL